MNKFLKLVVSILAFGGILSIGAFSSSEALPAMASESTMKVVDHIEVGGYTKKVVLDEEYVYDGVVYLVFTDYTQEITEEYSVSEVDTSSLGVKEVTISVDTQSVSFDITVIDKPYEGNPVILSKGAKIGIICGSVAGAALLCTSFYFLLKKLKVAKI